MLTDDQIRSALIVQYGEKEAYLTVTTIQSIRQRLQILNDVVITAVKGIENKANGYPYEKARVYWWLMKQPAFIRLKSLIRDPDVGVE